MELAREPGINLMAYAFVAAVVHIHEQLLPVGTQRLCIHGVAMVLARNIAPVGANHAYGLVMRAVTVLQLVYLRSASLCQQLVTHADTAYRLGGHAHLPAHNVHGILAHVGVAGTVGKEKTVEVHGRIVMVPWNTDYLHAPVYKATDDVVLHAAVYKDNFLVSEFPPS